MHLCHLGLPVGDRERSLDFYATYFGFDPATARSYPDGTTIVRNSDGFAPGPPGDASIVTGISR